jgi:hypothetical protein
MPGGIGIGVGFCLVGDDVDAEKAYVVVALLSVLLIIIKQHKYTATRLRFVIMMMYCTGDLELLH